MVIMNNIVYIYYCGDFLKIFEEELRRKVHKDKQWKDKGRNSKKMAKYKTIELRQCTSREIF